ncbi:hypothetical protein HX860_05900 [Marine Group I thaumarchaeote]|uniref:Uncharacterized protein n=1 Tax=Marine Group I thaumarchaeote TaxID=2511932 RepID=A0A7K4M940_9ARCH|nr:hypothetical protein [Marine Group I thaumarchaeote]
MNNPFMQENKLTNICEEKNLRCNECDAFKVVSFGATLIPLPKDGLMVFCV